MTVSMITILCLSGMSIYHLYNDYIVKRAETDAVSISQSFLASNQTLLLTPLSRVSRQLDLSSIESQKLDIAFRQFLPPFNIIKIKIFSTDGTIIYSTDPSIIGQFSRRNIHLNKALSGYNSSKMQTKNEMMDLAFESRFDVDVVETYVPIYNSNNVIVGSFEIYQDMTRFRSDVIKGVSLAILTLLLILLTVFYIAFKIVKHTTSELVLAQDELQSLATIDSLTSVYNRHYIFKQLKIEAARVFREKGKLSIVLIDLDFFKKINDSYGHQVGDEVLQEVAKTIQNNIREYNTVGRYGGEEFLILLPNSDSDSAVEIAERIRQSIEDIVIECDKQILSITISAGVSTLSYPEVNIERLIKRADDALYIAKGNGRNKVVQILP
jgi:diguanylate cyclase (GGDEF)-like protein